MSKNKAGSIYHRHTKSINKVHSIIDRKSARAEERKAMRLWDSEIPNLKGVFIDSQGNKTWRF